MSVSFLHGYVPYPHANLRREHRQSRDTQLIGIKQGPSPVLHRRSGPDPDAEHGELGLQWITRLAVPRYSKDFANSL